MDNRSHTLQLEDIKKVNDHFILTLSTDVNLYAIKQKHQFSEQRVIAHLKNETIHNRSIQIIGDFDSKKHLQKEGKYYYQANLFLKNTTQEEGIKNLNSKDTIIAFLQLSYKMGRTYPTLPIEFPAQLLININ